MMPGLRRLIWFAGYATGIFLLVEMMKFVMLIQGQNLHWGMHAQAPEHLQPLIRPQLLKIESVMGITASIWVVGLFLAVAFSALAR